MAKTPICSSLIALLITVMACDAVTEVDVYRLVQYDNAGVPLGSRLAALNHHAASSAGGAAADLSRTVLILPVRELNLTFIREYIEQRKPLGGLLLLLPPAFSPQYTYTEGLAHHDSAKDLVKEILTEVERLLVHANIPYPLYFGFEDERVNAMLADIKKNDVTGQPATATTGGKLWQIVASVAVDLLLLLVLGSYLIVLFSFLVITTRGFDDLISLFRRRPSSRKVKAA